MKAGESVAVALFVNNSYTGDYISALGTQVDATHTSATRITVTTSLADVTLKNGVMTVKTGSSAPYVVADEFNSYIVKTGASASVDTLVLDTTNTFGAAGSEGVLGSSSYAIVITDSNNYVTALYVVDVA